MSKLFEFAVDFIVAFAVIVALIAAGFVIALAPAAVVIWSGIPPHMYLPMMILWVPAIMAAWFAISEHLKRRAPKGPGR